MSVPSAHFRDKAKEIDLYFDFLKKVVVDGATLELPAKRKPKIFPIDTELQKILKANAIILLYNLVESSIRNGLAFIYDSIAKESINYWHLRKELQCLWLETWLKPEHGRSWDISNQNQKIHNVIGRILDQEIASFDASLIPIRGSLDAKRIRELSKKYGFSHKTKKVTRGGDLLVEIKNGRNDLAHGLKSFSEYGRDLTFEGLQDMKSQVEKYLGEILGNMERYVEGKEFKSVSQSVKIV